tara:strand:+ start:105 stop:722 length:618 start_codon:yes stop_codon:yes gene_type:complete
MKYLKKFFSSFRFPIILLVHVFFITLIFSTIRGHQESIIGKNKISGGDFTLQSSEGPLSLSDLRGSVVLIFFGYTACPSVCPISLATISHAFNKMNQNDLNRTKALFISLDPERDTLKILKQYTSYFHQNIVGLTDNIEILSRVAEQYGMKYEKTVIPESALGYVISHSSDIIVLNLNGKPSATFPHDTDSKPLLKHIRNILNSG